MEEGDYCLDFMDLLIILLLLLTEASEQRRRNGRAGARGVINLYVMVDRSGRTAGESGPGRAADVMPDAGRPNVLLLLAEAESERVAI